MCYFLLCLSLNFSRFILARLQFSDRPSGLSVVSTEILFESLPSIQGKWSYLTFCQTKYIVSYLKCTLIPLILSERDCLFKALRSHPQRSHNVWFSKIFLGANQLLHILEAHLKNPGSAAAITVKDQVCLCDHVVYLLWYVLDELYVLICLLPLQCGQIVRVLIYRSLKAFKISRLLLSFQMYDALWRGDMTSRKIRFCEGIHSIKSASGQKN